MVPVAQSTNDLGGQRIVEQIQDRSPTCAVADGYRTFVDMLTGTCA
jgi:hypothetical protein